MDVSCPSTSLVQTNSEAGRDDSMLSQEEDQAFLQAARSPSPPAKLLALLIHLPLVPSWLPDSAFALCHVAQPTLKAS